MRHRVNHSMAIKPAALSWLMCCTLLVMTGVTAPNRAYAIDWDVFDWFGSTVSEAPATEPAQPRQPVPIDQPHAIDDLAYGDLLFEFYQEHYFSAITKILVAKERGLFKNNSEHAELVLGALYVSYGLLDSGESIFNNLLNDYTSQEGADESWYQLARIFYKKGNPQRALDVLTNNIMEPIESRATEHVLLQVLCHIRLGQVSQAQSLTPYLKIDRAHSIFVRFNLGSAFAQLGDMEQAAGYYKDILNGNQPRSELDKTVHDQSALSLGIHYLRNNELELAEQTFHRIRLYGPVANRALLALGWTHFHADRKIDALTPWMTLNERPLTDPSVQESILNVPFVYENLGALQDSLDGYKAAYKIFRNQRRKLNVIKQDIQKPDWIEKISPVEHSSADIMGTLPEFQLPVNDEVTQHLYHYFASNEFQRLYKDYRELQRLYLVLSHWERQFPSFDEMINTHVNRLNELAPKAEHAVQQSQKFYAYSRVKLDEFETKLNEIIANDDIAGLANVAQLAQKERLDAIEATLEQLNDTDMYAEEWDKLALLKGLLLWDLNALAIDKRWEASKEQITLNNMLTELENRIRAVAAAREVRLNRFYGFETRVIELRQRVAQLKQETAQNLRSQRQVMQTVAVSIIEQQQKHLDTMRAKSLLSIARLQDLGYMQERDRKKLREKSIIFELEAENAEQTESTSSTAATDVIPVEEKGAAKNLGDVIRRIFETD
jgi:tetratricopeptide (TPR) repeat protein